MIIIFFLSIYKIQSNEKEIYYTQFIRNSHARKHGFSNFMYTAVDMAKL